MTEAPYDPHDAISKLKGEVQYDIQNHNTDAFIKRLGETSFCVHLNEARPPQRARFTLAHGLGHLFLHMGYIFDPEKWKSQSVFNESVFFRDSRYSKDEYEANEFAAAFLMPREEFLEIAEENLAGIKYRLQPIAEHFEVSIHAVSNRGKWLGLFQW